MTSRSESSSLRPYWVIGFTGHRQLPDPQAVGRALIAILESLRREIDGDLACVSSVAIGGDTLFACAALSLSIPWRALLPAPLAEFREDFSDDDWRIVEQLLAQAIEVDVRATSLAEGRGYLECGMDTVDQSDLTIAVWDQGPSRGIGGTADIVAYTRSVNKPLIVLNPETLEIQRERFSARGFVDPEMDYLNNLADEARSVPSASASAAAPEVLMRFFAKVDRMAARTAPNFRRWVAASLVMNTLATVLTACSIAFMLSLGPLDASVLALSAGAMGAGLYLKYRKIHRTWIHCRAAAETCRTAIATWGLPRLVLPAVPGQSATFARLATSLRMLHLRRRPLAGPGIDVLRERYIAERIDDQARYHTVRRVRLETRRQRLILLFWVCSALAVLRGLLVGVFGIGGLGEELRHLVSYFLPLALPCLAGFFLALISVFDLNGQLARSRETEAFLASARAETAACSNIYALQRAVERTERFLSREVAEWFTRSQEPRYG